MVMNNMSSTELVAEIRRRDRRFRVAQSSFMAVVIGALVVLISAQFLQLQSFKNQSAERSAAIRQILTSQQDVLSKQHADIERQTAYIQCIAQFFANPNRANLTLTDLDNCRIEQGGQPISVNLPSSNAGQAQPSTSQNTNSVTQTATTHSNDTQSQPAKILGIPLCVPLTKVCVTQ